LFIVRYLRFLQISMHQFVRYRLFYIRGHAMALDVQTLFFLTMYVEVILGLLLLLAWVQNPSTQAMAWWGSAHLMRSLSVAFYGLYGSVPGVVSIELAGVLLFTSFGLTWAGARVFDGRSAHPAWVLSGAVLWLVASQFPGFLGSGELRNLLSAVIVAGFSWAAAWELWRGRTEALMSRWPAIILLFAHGVSFLLRTPLNAAQLASDHALASAWVTVLSAESLLFSISIAFVALAIGKERSEQGHKVAARVDPLTGLPNRRAFMTDGQEITRTQIARGRPVAVFLIDLDHFKNINDSYGHAMGDRVLKLFSEVCRERLRATDLVGRLGGEEFGVLIADATRDNAFLVAERIRSAFQDAARMVEAEPVAATLSIGVSINQDPEQNFDAMLNQADQALYRAKGRGRNRIELAPLAGIEMSDTAKAQLAERLSGSVRAPA
jgi:diguanylate cyclase (GGDEF)-like protein